MWPRLSRAIRDNPITALMSVLVTALTVLASALTLISQWHNVRKDCPAPIPSWICTWPVPTAEDAPPTSHAAAAPQRARDLLSHLKQRALSQARDEQECDHLAANPNDPAKIVPGIKFGEIEAERAIAACEVAAARFPTIPRFNYQLARAYQRGSKANLAFSIFQDLVQQKYIAAYDNLGWLYLDNRVVPQDVKKAIALFKQGAAANQPEAMTSLCRVHEDLQDFANAKYWCERAAALGYEEAKERLQKLQEPPAMAPGPLPFPLPFPDFPRTSRR